MLNTSQPQTHSRCIENGQTALLSILTISCLLVRFRSSVCARSCLKNKIHISLLCPPQCTSITTMEGEEGGGGGRDGEEGEGEEGEGEEGGGRGGGGEQGGGG